VESNSHNRIPPKKKDKSTASDDDRYYFGLDIGSYWYAPLGRVFALTQDKIETEALKVIRTEFGFTGKGRWDEDERSKRKLYEENHTYYQGSHPRADTLHFYHAYHAMMVVAGKLLTRMPTHRDPEFDEEDEFADWLDGHDLSRKDRRWIWDRRDPTPLEHPSWQDRTREKDTLPVVTVDDFEEALHAGGEMLNVWGHWTAADSDTEQSAHIGSALVSPDKSFALLRALGTAKGVHDYALPTAESDLQIDEIGFELKGWIVDDSHDRGLDSQDRWAGGISFPPPMPAPYIIDAMGLETDSDWRLWLDREKSVVMASQVWGHFDEARRHESSDPERGSRIQASLTFLTTLLAKLGRDLIIEVKIDRRRRSRPYESGVEYDKERIPTKARLYLLGADGRLRAL
jgi:hypothetical protein